MKKILPLLILLPFAACRSTSTCVDQEIREKHKDDICIMIYDPVCGCDGKTYGNDCEARRNGVVTVTKGECR